MQDKLYKVIGGGFYRYTINTRSKRGRWLRKDVALKKTERELFTEEEAGAILYNNAHSYVRMGGAKMIEA